MPGGCLAVACFLIWHGMTISASTCAHMLAAKADAKEANAAYREAAHKVVQLTDQLADLRAEMKLRTERLRYLVNRGKVAAGREQVGMRSGMRTCTRQLANWACAQLGNGACIPACIPLGCTWASTTLHSRCLAAAADFFVVICTADFFLPFTLLDGGLRFASIDGPVT